MGLDPGLGLVHTDQPARDSLALDALEPVRPSIERSVLDLVDAQVFRKADFYETRRGVFRVGTDLARPIAETLPLWRRELAPIVEEVAVAIGSSTNKPVRVATKLTEVRRPRVEVASGRSPWESRRVGSAGRSSTIPKGSSVTTASLSSTGNA
jgi:hypothetical protein